MQPASPYGVAKLTCEHYLRCFHSVHGLSYAALRYANVYGPRQSTRGESGVIALFADWLLRGQPVRIHGDGCQTRDFVYVDDVVEASPLAMQSNVRGAFNVGTGVETSINDIFVHLKGFIRSSVHPKYAPAKAGEQRRSVLDISRIARRLDWWAANGSVFRIKDGTWLTSCQRRLANAVPVPKLKPMLTIDLLLPNVLVVPCTPPRRCRIMPGVFSRP